MNKDQGRGLSRRAFVGRVTAGAAGGALAISMAGKASALALDEGIDAGRHLTKPGGESPAATGHPTLEPVAPSAISESGASAAPAPWELVHPLNAGSPLSAGWSVRDLSGVVTGACVLTLANPRGREHRVHICRNGGAPQGLVYTEKFDLVVMNGGRGDLPTEEDFGHAVAAVAHAIAANEKRGAEITGLLSQSEREERFAAAAHLR